MFFPDSSFIIAHCALDSLQVGCNQTFWLSCKIDLYMEWAGMEGIHFALSNQWWMGLGKVSISLAPCVLHHRAQVLTFNSSAKYLYADEVFWTENVAHENEHNKCVPSTTICHKQKRVRSGFCDPFSLLYSLQTWAHNSSVGRCFSPYFLTTWEVHQIPIHLSVFRSQDFLCCAISVCYRWVVAKFTNAVQQAGLNL